MNIPLKKTLLIHNPGAGGEDHSEKALIQLIQNEGYTCIPGSLNKSELENIQDFDSIVVAGGDGTIRKTVKKLLNRKILDRSAPVYILPLGTANNIATTLGIIGEPENIIASWKYGKTKQYDVGVARSMDDTFFFLESFGYGLFPYLMQQMNKLTFNTEPTPEEKLNTSLNVLLDIINSYKPEYCTLNIDGIDHSGNYLLAEIMNTRSIGPNLILSPDADPGDGTFEVALVPETDKEKLAAYVEARIMGKDAVYHFLKIPGRRVTITWQGKHAHTDDEIIKIPPSSKFDIQLKEGVLEFMVPGDSLL